MWEWRGGRWGRWVSRNYGTAVVVSGIRCKSFSRIPISNSELVRSIVILHSYRTSILLMKL